jgi:acyl-CoA synthetase (AMP-forming)/AMP-acid ligase II
VHYDDTSFSIPSMVQQSATDFGDKTYIVDGDLTWSFAELEQRMLEAGRAFVALGVKPGDRVALLGPNSAQWIQSALGVHSAGGILIPLNTRFKGEELAHILRKSGAMAVVTVGDFLGLDHVGMMRASAPDSAALERIVVLDDAVIEGTTTFTDFLATASTVEESEVQARINALTGADISDIMFTSGTTGAPKGVKLRHGASLRGYDTLMDYFTVSSADTHAIIPPFFHCFGYKAGWLGALIKGAKIIPMRTFDPVALMETIQAHEVSVMLGPPTIFVDMMSHPRRKEFDLTSLRAAAAGAASVPIKLINDMHEDLGFDVVLNAYGLTESHALVSTCLPSDPVELVAGSCGRAMDGLEVVIMDDELNILPAGETGEIMVRGYTVMEGYWEEPEETAKALTPDGWLHTGDIGNIDTEGYIRISDRKKDMFIVGGFNAYPAEIEAILTKHPKVLHAAVVGVPDERMGEAGWAYVTAKPGTELTEQEVHDFARDNLANYKVPRRVIVVDELPRNASMKVLKFDLRAQALAIMEAEAKAHSEA